MQKGVLPNITALHWARTSQSSLLSAQDLLADSNPMVVANAVAALADIRETSTHNLLVLTNQALFKLLRALNECTEWGQV